MIALEVRYESVITHVDATACRISDDFMRCDRPLAAAWAGSVRRGLCPILPKGGPHLDMQRTEIAACPPHEPNEGLRKTVDLSAEMGFCIFGDPMSGPPNFFLSFGERNAGFGVNPNVGTASHGQRLNRRNVLEGLSCVAYVSVWPHTGTKRRKSDGTRADEL